MLVGRRVRMLRVSRRLSQGHVAGKLGITFQQVQKYENGANRISVSKLYEIAGLLGVEVADLFADAGDPEKLAAVDADPPRRIDLLIAHALARLPDGQLKNHVTGLILELARKAPAAIAAE
jgi:transcriptional regulator with XRE-family HTH domain